MSRDAHQAVKIPEQSQGFHTLEPEPEACEASAQGPGCVPARRRRRGTREHRTPPLSPPKGGLQLRKQSLQPHPTAWEFAYPEGQLQKS